MRRIKRIGESSVGAQRVLSEIEDAEGPGPVIVAHAEGMKIKRMKRDHAMGALGAGEQLFAAGENQAALRLLHDLTTGTVNELIIPDDDGSNQILPRTLNIVQAINTSQWGTDFVVMMTGDLGAGPSLQIGKILTNSKVTSNEPYLVMTTQNLSPLNVANFYDTIAPHSAAVELRCNSAPVGNTPLNGLMSAWVFRNSQQMAGIAPGGVLNPEEANLQSMNPDTTEAIYNSNAEGVHAHFGPEILAPLAPTRTALVQAEQERETILDVVYSGGPIPSSELILLSVEGNQTVNYGFSVGGVYPADTVITPNFIPRDCTLTADGSVTFTNTSNQEQTITISLWAYWLRFDMQGQLQVNTTGVASNATTVAAGGTATVAYSGTSPGMDGDGNTNGTLVGIAMRATTGGPGGTAINVDFQSYVCQLYATSSKHRGRFSPVILMNVSQASEGLVYVVRANYSIVATGNPIVSQAIGPGRMRLQSEPADSQLAVRLAAAACNAADNAATRVGPALTLREEVNRRKSCPGHHIQAAGFLSFLKGLAHTVSSVAAPILSVVAPEFAPIAGVIAQATAPNHARGKPHRKHKFRVDLHDKDPVQLQPMTRREFDNLLNETANHSASTAMAAANTGKRLHCAVTTFPTVNDQGKPAQLVTMYSTQKALDDVAYNILMVNGTEFAVDARIDLSDEEANAQTAEILNYHPMAAHWPVITLGGIGTDEIVDGNSFGLAMNLAISGVWSPKVAYTGAVVYNRLGTPEAVPVLDVQAKTDLANDNGRILVAANSEETQRLAETNPESVIHAGAIASLVLNEAPALILVDNAGEAVLATMSTTMMLSKRSGKEDTDPNNTPEAIRRRIEKEGVGNVVYDVAGQMVPLFDPKWWNNPEVKALIGPTEKGGLGSDMEKVNEHLKNLSYKKLLGLATTIVNFMKSRRNKRGGVRLKRLARELTEPAPSSKKFMRRSEAPTAPRRVRIQNDEEME